MNGNFDVEDSEDDDATWKGQHIFAHKHLNKCDDYEYLVQFDDKKLYWTKTRLFRSIKAAWKYLKMYIEDRSDGIILK